MRNNETQTLFAELPQSLIAEIIMREITNMLIQGELKGEETNMVEVHGWITLRETYKVVDDDNIEALLKLINNEIGKIAYPQIQVNVNNGNYYIEFSVYTNHMSGAVSDLIAFFETVGKIAEGSYGLLYLHNDEDQEKYNNFVVHRLARGTVEVYQDTLLSPTIPTVEDEWI